MKTKLFLMLFCICFLGFAQVSEAAERDIARYTCQELMDEGGDSMIYMTFWMDGYLSAASDNTVMDDEWMQSLAMHLADHCNSYPRDNMMDVIDNL